MSINIGNSVPAAFFKRISLESSQMGEQTIATVDITLKQSKELQWNVDGFKERLKVHLIRVSDITLFNRYTSPAARMELINTVAKSQTVKNHSLHKAEIHSINISNSPYYNKKTKTSDFAHTNVFRIKEKEPRFLAFIAVVCYGMQPRLSEVTAEIVIQNGSPITEAKTLISSGAAPGIEQAVINTTIQDFRDVEKIKNLKIDEAIVQKSIFDPQHSTLAANNKKKPKNAYFSDINLAFDTQGSCRYQFSINWAEMIKDYSQFSRLIASEDEDGNISLDYEKFNFQKILSLSRIKSIVIKRRKVHYLDKYTHSCLMNTLVSNTAMKTFADNKEEVIASSNDIGRTLASKSSGQVKSSTNEEKTLKQIGYIREIDDLFMKPAADNKGKIIPSSQLRHFTGIDFSMKENNDGEYHYSVEIEIKDGTVDYIQDMIERLKADLRDLESYNYHITLSDKNPKLNFKTVSNNFVNVHDLDLSSFIKNGLGPWQRASATLTEVVKTFELQSPTADTPSSNMHQNLYLMSSPHNGSLKGISKLIEATRIVLSKLENMLKISSGGVQNLGSDSTPKSSGLGSKYPLNIFKIKHDFEENINAREFIKAGYGYLGENRLTGLRGLQSIDLRNFLNRIREETLKYFSINQINANKIMAGTKFEDSVLTTEMSYLTPRNIYLSPNIYEMYVVEGDKIKALLDKNTVKALIDILAYKNFGYVPETDVAPEEGGNFTKSICDENDVKHPTNQKITNKLSDLFSLSDCTIEPYDFRSECSIDLMEDEIEKRDILGVAVTKQSDSEIEDTPDDTATTTKNKMPLQTHVNNVLVPLTYIKHTNILGENYRLKAYDTNSSTFKLAQPTKRKFLPNHFKSLIADSVSPTAVNFNWFSEENTLEKIAFFVLHYKTLATIEALAGFKNGNLRQPVWQMIDRSVVDRVATSDKRNLLCRIRPYTDSKQNSPCSGPAKLEAIDLPIYNQYFLLNIVDPKRQLTRAIAPINTIIESTSKILESNALLRIDNELIYTKPVQQMVSFGVTVSPTEKKALPLKRKTGAITPTAGPGVGSMTSTTGTTTKMY